MTIVLCDACGAKIKCGDKENMVSFDHCYKGYSHAVVCEACAAKAAEQLTKYKRENKNG